MRLNKKLHCGSTIPDFCLPDMNGTIFPKDRLLNSFGLCIMFLCENNYYVQHICDVLVKLIKEYQLLGLSAAAIYPLSEFHTYEPSSQFLNFRHLDQYPFPCLIDHSLDTARHFGVTRIPDFFLFDRHGTLIYHGRMDESKPENNKPVTGKDLRTAIDALFHGDQITLRQRPGFGIPIKRK